MHAYACECVVRNLLSLTMTFSSPKLHVPTAVSNPDLTQGTSYRLLLEE